MLNFNLERFKKLPQQPGVFWEGGLFRLPTWVQEKKTSEPFRPIAVFWINTAEGVLSQPAFIEEQDPYEAAFEALLHFGLEAGRKGHRPVAVRVNDAELAAFLDARLKVVGICVDHVATLPTIQQMLDDLARRLNGREEPPGCLSGNGVNVGRVRAYAAAAARFYEAKPWVNLSDDDLIAVEHPPAPKGMKFASILGHGGEVFGIGFFGDRKDFDKMYSSAAPERTLTRNGVWSLTFGKIIEFPFSDVDLWEEKQLPVAGKDAYPFAAWFGPKTSGLRRPDANELAFLEGLLNAIAAITPSHLDRGRWTCKVSAGGAEAEYRLALVHEIESSQEQADALATSPTNLHRAMEKSMAQLHRILEEQDFDSVEDANAFIQQALNADHPFDSSEPGTPLEHAQELMYEAWEAPSGRRRRMLARKALEICPDCADAYVLLAEDTSDSSQALDYFRKGVEAGERALGRKFFKNEAGRFWGILETRPYMRACFGLAQVLWVLNQRDEAVSHFFELLRLNPNDNQGVRYVLAAYLLEMGDDKRLSTLLDQYDEDDSPQWLYLRALAEYRKKGDSGQARKCIKQAMKSNKLVPDYLSGKRKLPRNTPGSYQVGGKDEAIICAFEIRGAWRATPGAIDWLKTVIPS